MAFPIAGCICYMLRRADGGVDRHWLSGPPRPSPRGLFDGDFSNYVSCAPWDEWERLSRAAHAAKHRALTAADLKGRRAGDAFIECVIRDPKVHACVAWLSLEFSDFGRLLTDNVFPSPLTVSKFGPPLIFDGIKWPVILDQNKLSREIDRMALSGEWWNRSLAPPDETNSLFHAAQAIANQHKVFFDLLRGGELDAEGTSEATFSIQKIQNDQWNRPDRYLDVKVNDMLCLDDSRSLRKICTGIKLSSNVERLAAHRVAAGPAAGANVVLIKRNQKSAPSSHAAGMRKRFKPGREPLKSEATRAEMRAFVLDGKGTLQELEDMQPKYLVKHFGRLIGRTSLSPLRNEVVSELKSRQIATNDK
jgi:hypothetical protein